MRKREHTGKGKGNTGEEEGAYILEGDIQVRGEQGHTGRRCIQVGGHTGKGGYTEVRRGIEVGIAHR